MELELKYTIEDSAIAELFGKQSFTTKESAILELVKNCFDARATFCEINFKNDAIFIKDDGMGMNSESIVQNWMHVGKSSKGYKDEESDRVLAGSKGIGRFALARLGNKVELLSNPQNGEPVRWETDWEHTVLSNSNHDEKGTEIKIFDLREKWRKKDVDNLVDFLNRSYNSDKMLIRILFEDESRNISPVYKNLQLGVDYTSKIELFFSSDDCKLVVDINSDEFDDDIKPIVEPMNYKYHHNSLEMISEFLVSKFNENELNKEEIENMLRRLGSFNATLFFGVSHNNKDLEKFHYKYQKASNIYPFDIILYRNNFSISSFEGKKDWLNIEKRARKSPAAATHPTGAWRVRLNQIDGVVIIDKKDNYELVDLANRQGLDENEYYDLFVKIIENGLSEFERYRQSIIRKIAQHHKRILDLEIKKESKSLEQFLKKPESANKMSEEELTEVAKDIVEIKKQHSEEKRAYKDEVAKFAYENRILNVLATQGLRASSVAHEYHTKNNILGSSPDFIIKALKSYGYWEELNSYEKTKKAYKNVPKLIEDLKKIDLELGRFLETMLNKIEKSSFSNPIDSLNDEMKDIISNWERNYSKLSINFKPGKEKMEIYKIYQDTLTVIFDNLILNSIQHNSDDICLNIDINAKYINGKIRFSYSDDGIGLSDKYIDNPNRILEVHESSRRDGHGLGMWMLNTTLLRNNGEVIKIKSNNGFYIEFDLEA